MADRIFISGVSSGIGKQTCKDLLDAGYEVFGTVRKQEDKIKLTDEFGINFHCLILDLEKNESIDQCVSELKHQLKGQKLYAIINNAGVAIPGPLHLVSEEKFSKQMLVNLHATRKLTNALIAELSESINQLKPRIIFISSVSGIFATPFNGPYCISKHALECMVDIYRRELKYLGIEVVSILPGPIRTKIWDKAKGQFDQYKIGPFASVAQKADDIILATEKSALPVSVVSQRIIRILAQKKNRNRYLIHRNALLISILAHLTPSSWVDKMIWKNLGKPGSTKIRPV